MGFWDKLENFENIMKKWHNRLYKWSCFGIFMLFVSVWGLGITGWGNFRNTVLALEFEPHLLLYYDMLAWIGGPVLLGWLGYTILFTQFGFPVRFRGGGKGKSIEQPPTST